MNELVPQIVNIINQQRWHNASQDTSTVLSSLPKKDLKKLKKLAKNSNGKITIEIKAK